MKKLLLIILLFIFFIPVVVYAEECDTSKVSISSITLDETNNVTETNGATASDKSINLNLNMSEVGDSIKYKFTIKNDSNEDYLLDKNSVNVSSNYIDYVISTDDNSNIIKAKSSKNIYLNVQYKNKVPDDAYENGLFNDNVKMKVNLLSKSLNNPNTGVKYILFIALVLFIMVIILIVFRKKRIVNIMLFIFGLIIIIPASVKALCRFDIDINSNIKIYNSLITTLEQKKEGELSVGDEISVRGEHFYIISTNSEKTDLIAKYNLFVGYNVVKAPNGNGYVLDSEISTSDSRYGWQSEETVNNRNIALVPFSGRKYWQSIENENMFNPNYPDARDKSVYDKNLSIVAPIVENQTKQSGTNYLIVHESDYSIAYYIEPYIKKLRDMGLFIYEGNVLSHEQASTLGCGYGASCSTSFPWIRNTDFWTGSVAWLGHVSYQNQLISIYVGYSTEEYNTVSSGVRPTITIRTSDIPLLDHDYFVNKPIITY